MRGGDPDGLQACVCGIRMGYRCIVCEIRMGYRHVWVGSRIQTPILMIMKQVLLILDLFYQPLNLNVVTQISDSQGCMILFSCYDSQH